MTTTLTIDKAGRMVIPKAFRQALRLESGAKLTAHVQGGNLVLEPIPDEIELVQEGKRRVICGWAGYDAAEAVRDSREAAEHRMES